MNYTFKATEVNKSFGALSYTCSEKVGSSQGVSTYIFRSYQKSSTIRDHHLAYRQQVWNFFYKAKPIYTWRPGSTNIVCLMLHGSQYIMLIRSKVEKKEGLVATNQPQLIIAQYGNKQVVLAYKNIVVEAVSYLVVNYTFKATEVNKSF